jgi:hypothetical protein
MDPIIKVNLSTQGLHNKFLALLPHYEILLLSHLTSMGESVDCQCKCRCVKVRIARGVRARRCELNDNVCLSLQGTRPLSCPAHGWCSMVMYIVGLCSVVM